MQTNPENRVFLCLERSSELTILANFCLWHIKTADGYLDFTTGLPIPVKHRHALIEALALINPSQWDLSRADVVVLALHSERDRVIE